jgi:two-component system response regulator FixJ
MNTERTTYIVDDDTAFLDSVRALLKSAGFKTRTFSSAKAFLACDLEQGSCLITNIHMPEMNGLELLTELKRRKVSMPVIVMTGRGDIPLAVRSMQAGAVNFIEKPFDDNILIDAVRTALETNSRWHDTDAEAKIARVLLATLTPGELAVLEQMIAGRSNKISAHLLGVSIRTIETHRSHIMLKLKVRNLADVVRINLSAA